MTEDYTEPEWVDYTTGFVWRDEEQKYGEYRMFLAGLGYYTARWGLAMHYATLEEVDWHSLSYERKESLLASAQRELDKYPEDIPYWVDEFRKHD